MSTTQGNVGSPRGIVNVKDEPDHLLVLVHGILARYISFTNLTTVKFIYQKAPKFETKKFTMEKDRRGSADNK